MKKLDALHNIILRDVEEVLEFSHLPLISPFMDRHGFYSADTTSGESSDSDTDDTSQ